MRYPPECGALNGCGRGEDGQETAGDSLFGAAGMVGFPLRSRMVGITAKAKIPAASRKASSNEATIAFCLTIAWMAAMPL